MLASAGRPDLAPLPQGAATLEKWGKQGHLGGSVVECLSLAQVVIDLISFVILLEVRKLRFKGLQNLFTDDE